jgi:leucyl aminopeptidase
VIKTSVTAAAASDHSCDLLALCVREGAVPGEDLQLRAVDKALEGLLGRVAAEEEFRGREGQQLLLHTHGKIGARRVLLVGLGKAKEGDAHREALRLAAARVVKASRSSGAKAVGLGWPSAAGLEPLAEEVFALAEGAGMGAYRFDKYLKEKKPLKLAALRLLLEGKAAAHAKAAAGKERLAGAIELGTAFAEATCLARDLVNEPPARMTPRALAAAAEEVARRHGLALEVHGKGGIDKLGMNLFLAVSQGSEEKPQLVKMSWLPKNAEGEQRPLALVGKAITFDSGGLSLKTAQGMEDMKVDMGGAAAVIAAMDLVARLKPPFPVHGFFGACENLPSGSAYKPGDVITGKGGLSVEVLNTDAEGRLVLADVLAWAVEHEPSAVIDLATLTGAIMVALGPWTSGLFSNDDGLAAEVQAAAGAAGEQVWRLPMPADMEELVKSPIADLKNTGGRYGGSITAALFLQKFVGKTPWVHLDIAGPASIDKEKGYHPRGGTGAGVRLLGELVRRRMQG